MPPAGVPGKESGQMPKRHLEGSTQEARATMRQRLGSLKSLTVQPVTRKRYDAALESFFQYLRSEKLILPTGAMAIDRVCSDYLEYLWAQGHGRSDASNFIAALQDTQPHLRGKLAQSWRLLKAWVTNEVPNRAPPLPLQMLESMVGHALFKKDFGFALSLLVGFHGLLRTGEILGITAAHVSVSKPKGPAVISLGLTKAGKRQGASESVTLHGEDICRRLHQWVHTARNHDSLAGPSHIWRQKFNVTLEALSLHKWDFRPYSLRRGGATHQFKMHGAFDRLMSHGRWQSLRTARLYINDGLAVLAELKIPLTAMASNLRAQYHRSLTIKLPPLEPAPRKRARAPQKGGTWKKRSQRKSTRKKKHLAC